MARCACGCGGAPNGRSKYLRGHNVSEAITPAGMSLERAFEIAADVLSRLPADTTRFWGKTKSIQNSGNSNGLRLTDSDRARIIGRYRAGESALEIAALFGVTDRTVFRVVKESDSSRRSA